MHEMREVLEKFILALLKFDLSRNDLYRYWNFLGFQQIFQIALELVESCPRKITHEYEHSGYLWLIWVEL